MSDNVDQFAIYAAKVFEILYDSFPVPSAIDRRDVISEYLTFDNDEELKKLKVARDFADIVGHVDDEELKAKAKEKRPAIETRLAELERDQRNDVDRLMEPWTFFAGKASYVTVTTGISSPRRGFRI